MLLKLYNLSVSINLQVIPWGSKKKLVKALGQFIFMKPSNLKQICGIVMCNCSN